MKTQMGKFLSLAAAIILANAPQAYAATTDTIVSGTQKPMIHRPYTQLRNQIVVLPDSDSIGGPDIGVIAQRSSDGRLRMEIRNARGGGTTRAFFFSRNEPRCLTGAGQTPRCDAA